MLRWVRFVDNNDKTLFGALDGQTITRFTGDLFDSPTPTTTQFDLHDVRLLPPCEPSKVVALWNNFHAVADKEGWEKPSSPLYFIKPSSCIIGTREAIQRPAGFAGRVMYEGELAIVIGQTCKSVDVDGAGQFVFGYTCINDVTALSLIRETAAFEQWTRAKSFDTFGPIGPCIATGLEPQSLVVKTEVNGRVRQNYPLSDMILGIAQIVSAISNDMTLYPGDIIAVGTSAGVLPMKPNTKVAVTIEGIGTLENVFDPT